MDWRCVWVIFCLFLAVPIRVNGDVFTALVEMVDLVYREKEMIASIKDYLKQEETRLEKIREFTRKLDKIHEVIPQNRIENYLGHPSNAYLLIKRFVKEWPRVEDLAKNPSVDDFNAVLTKHRGWLPEESDLKGAITAIFRIQEVFKVKARDLSRDLVPSATRCHLMEAGDAMTIGKGAYEQEKFKRSKTWLETALGLWKEGRRAKDDDIVEILDYLSYAEYKVGNLRKAYNLTLNMLMHEPFHERAQKNLRYYAEELKKAGLLPGMKSGVAQNIPVVTDDDDDEVETEEDDNWKGSRAYKTYAKICRADPDAMHKYTLDEQRQLKCWFHKKHPWLYMRGIGVERIHVTPEMIYFRNVLTDGEINIVKKLGQPKLKRALIQHYITGVEEVVPYRISKRASPHTSLCDRSRRVCPVQNKQKLRRAVIQHPVTGKLETADYRISKSGWLKDEEDPVILRITKRTEYLTGLTLSTAEELQVNTYGMGGHYEPHYDHAQDHEDKFSDLGSGNRIATILFYENQEKFPSLGTGNRIATTLYYMSDVELGGGTAFINAGALVVPRKGDGVFWFNLFRNGKGNDDTRHAACPVFVGSKWVANKWIHEKGQEFRHKCALSQWE